MAVPTGDFAFWIPFLFMFAVVFGALSQGKLFNKAVNVVIALALSLFAAFYSPVTAVLWQYMPILVWFFVIVFFFGFIKKLLGGKEGGGFGAGPAAISFLLLLTVGWSTLQFFPVNVPIIGGAENIIFLFGLIFILVLFYGTMKEKEAPPKQEG